MSQNIYLQDVTIICQNVKNLIASESNGWIHSPISAPLHLSLNLIKLVVGCCDILIHILLPLCFTSSLNATIDL